MLIGGNVLAEKSNACTKDKETQAERAIDELTSWQKVYDAYTKFVQCDDGAIAEGYTDKISDLLAYNWKAIGELLKFIRINPQFERFILEHVDTLTTQDQAKAIIANSREHCDATAAEFCNRLAQKVQHPDN